MSTVDYLPVANNAGAVVESQADYLGQVSPGGTLEDGYQNGILRPEVFNKTIRQSSVGVAALANAVSSILGQDVLDDGDVAALTTKIIAAMRLGLTVGTMAALRALAVPVAPVSVFVLGYYAPLVGAGGGQYYWDSASALADNGGSIIQPDSLPATGRWFLKYSTVLHVQQFGAKGDGIADDSDAIIACKNAAVATTMAGNSGIYGSGPYVGTSQDVEFGVGVYKVTKAITADTDQAVNYLRFKGNNAIIVISAGVVAFGGVGYEMTFDGLIFRGGAVAISIKTANVNSTHITIVNCEFHNQTTAMVRTDATSPSTLNVIHNNKFFQQTTGNVLRLLSGDHVDFAHNWVQCSAPVCFYSEAGRLIIKDCCGVPEAGMLIWVDNYGSVDFDTYRFGGEVPDVVFVRNNSTMDTSNPIVPTYVILRNLEAYSSNYAINFVKLPNVVWIVGARGFVASKGFTFDATLTSADFVNFATYGKLVVDNNFVDGGGGDLLARAEISATSNLGIMLFNAIRVRDNPGLIAARERLRVAEVWGSGGITIGTAGWNVVTSVRMTPTTAADAYGVDNYVLTATLDDAQVQFTRDDYLHRTALTYGDFYTLNVTVDVDVKSIATISIQIGGIPKQFQLGNGKRVLSVPFLYLNGTGADNPTYDGLIITANLRDAGDVLKIGRHVLTAGLAQYTKETLVLEAAGAPGAYTSGIAAAVNHGYYQGDRNYRTNFAAAGAWGDFRSVGGTWEAVT